MIIDRSICFVFVLVFSLELETKKGWKVPIIHLYIWDVAEQKLGAIGTGAKSFSS